MTGIVGYGVYVPKYRITREEYVKSWGHFAARGVLEKTVARFDEDTATMAVEAAWNALNQCNVNPEEVDCIYAGTASPPYAEKTFSSTIASALGAKEKIALTDFGMSTKAGVAALLSCIDFISAGKGRLGLAVASDNLKARPDYDLEHALGAAASAYVIGLESTVAEVEETYHVGYEMWGGRLRRDGENYQESLGLTRYTRLEYVNTVASAIKGLMEKASRNIEDVNYVVVHQPDAREPIRLLRGLGFNDNQYSPGIIAPYLGDSGSCSPLIGLAGTLDVAEEGDTIITASYGSGASSDAILIQVHNTVSSYNAPTIKEYLESKTYLDYTTYMKWRRFFRDLDPRRV